MPWTWLIVDGSLELKMTIPVIASAGRIGRITLPHPCMSARPPSIVVAINRERWINHPFIFRGVASFKNYVAALRYVARPNFTHAEPVRFSRRYNFQKNLFSTITQEPATSMCPKQVRNWFELCCSDWCRCQVLFICQLLIVFVFGSSLIHWICRRTIPSSIACLIWCVLRRFIHTRSQPPVLSSSSFMQSSCFSNLDDNPHPGPE